MVRLQHRLYLDNAILTYGLNSTMVRLQPGTSHSHGFNPSRSQFHYGSITTLFPIESLYRISKSQFHYGSITTFRSRIYLNSTSKSQFHYGSITTQALLSLTLTEYRVSIPLWFDYNLFVTQREQISNFGLNSTMVLLQLIRC